MSYGLGFKSLCIVLNYIRASLLPASYCDTLTCYHSYDTPRGISIVLRVLQNLKTPSGAYITLAWIENETLAA